MMKEGRPNSNNIITFGPWSVNEAFDEEGQPEIGVMTLPSKIGGRWPIPCAARLSGNLPKFTQSLSPFVHCPLDHGQPLSLAPIPLHNGPV